MLTMTKQRKLKMVNQNGKSLSEDFYFNIHKMRNIYQKIVEHNRNAINTGFLHSIKIIVIIKLYQIVNYVLVNNNNNDLFYV